MNAKEYLTKTFKIVPHEILIRERAKCNDGFSISIQGSCAHYCTPRKTLANGKYTHLELGYPNRREEMLNEYDEGDGGISVCAN